MKSLLILVIVFGVAFSVCPNNCNGHGTCGANGVCSCFKKSDGYDNDYVGSDCSERGCGSGKSFSSLNSNTKYGDRKADDGSFIYTRSLNENREVASADIELAEIVSKTDTKAKGVYLVKTKSAILYYDGETSAGKINCYDSKNAVFAGEIIKVGGDLEYYVNDASNEIKTGMKCLLVMKYNDLSLINPITVDASPSTTVTWPEMSSIFPEIKSSVSGLKMACLTLGNAINDDNTHSIDSINVKENSGDIEFTLSTSPSASGTCVLLAKIDGDSITAVKDGDGYYTDYTRYYPATPISKPSNKAVNMYGVKDEYEYVYTIPAINIVNTYEVKSFGLLKCHIPRTREIQTAYLLGNDSKTDNYYILYNFTLVDGEGKEITTNLIPILYYCELSQYSDYSMYFPVKVPDAASCKGASTCSITWNNMCDIFNENLPTAEATIQFACREENKDEVQLYDFTIPKECTTGSNVVFTTSISVADNLPAGKICNLIAGKNAVGDNKTMPIDISDSELYKNHLTKNKTSKEWKYYSSLPTAKELATITSSKIYKVNGLNIISGSTGGIMKCTKYEKGVINTINNDVNLLYKNGNDYYTNTDIAGNECELLYSHKDMTLYPSKPIDDKKTVTFEKMSYYFQLLGFYNSMPSDKVTYTMLCGEEPATPGVEFTEYEFILTKPTVTYYEANSEDVKFTKVGDDLPSSDVKCFLLSSFDGKKVKVNESDLMKKYVITLGDNKKWTISLKPTLTKLSGDIYPITGVEYKGISLNSAGGLLECRNKINNKPLGFAKIYSYFKDNKNTPTYAIQYYFVKTDLTPTPEYYNCSVVESYKDLTLYLPPQTYDSTGVTWSNVKPIFKYIYEGYSSSKTTVNMLCDVDGSGKYKIFPVKASDSDSTTDIIFAVDTGTTPPTTNQKCFLMADSDGKEIITLEDIKNSDLGKLYDITESSDSKVTFDFTLSLKSTIPEIKKTASTGICELSNVNYDVGTELSCLTYDKNEVLTGVILKKEEGNKNKMSFTTDRDLSVLKCMIINKYNDLSNYVTCTVDESSPSTSCTTSMNNNVLFNLGLKNDKYTFQCAKDGEESKSYESEEIKIEDNTSPPSITFPSSDPSLPPAGAICHLLSSLTGTTITIDKSEVYSTNFIGYDVYNYHKEDEKPNIDTKPQPVPSDNVDIIGNVGEIGANLQCKNKADNRFLGLAVLLGKDEEGNFIMKYLFDIPKDSNSYICEVNEPINDLSLIKSEEITVDDCSSKSICMIIISGILNMLKSIGFYDSEDNTRMLLLQNEYEVSCVDKSSKVTTYLVNPFDEVGEDAIFVLSPNDRNANPPIGMECRLLARADGSPIKLKDSQYGSKLYYDETKNEFSESPCTPGDNENGICNKKDDESQIVVSSNEIIEEIKAEYNKSGRFFIPTDTSNRTIIENYLQPGKWISINAMYYQIINIYYSKLPTRIRQLRELAADTVKGYYVTLDKEVSLSGSDGSPVTTFTILLNANSNNGYDSHIPLECSGQGKCNRETGLCECFDGYTGDACQRLDCPNNCNGNGRCVPLSELLSNEDLKSYSGFGNKYTVESNGVDIVFDDEVYGCLCDKRHRGYDCSLIECPSGEDPEKATNIKDENDGEKRDCSGRGICNYNTGICECFDGFSGEGCQTQTQMM